jgi:hypothetical protein
MKTLQVHHPDSTKNEQKTKLQINDQDNKMHLFDEIMEIPANRAHTDQENAINTTTNNHRDNSDNDRDKSDNDRDKSDNDQVDSDDDQDSSDDDANKEIKNMVISNADKMTMKKGV